MDGFFGYFIWGLAIFAAFTLRYVVMAGLAYMALHRWFPHRFAHMKLDPNPQDPRVVRHEFIFGLLHNVAFGVIGAVTIYLYKHGLLKVYWDWSAQPIWYYLILPPVLFIVHDAYFFWAHYLMHKSRLKIFEHHGTHHYARNVSPFSAFSVHPAEAFAEVMIRPLLLLLIPMQPVLFVVFELISFALNIIGHCGFELFPRGGAANPVMKYFSSATFHFMHHQDGRTNLSLYFNFWDRVMGTMNEGYPELYSKVTSRVPEAPKQARL